MNCNFERKYRYYPKDTGGFILVVTMSILVVLSIIGISATSTTEIELQIAGNDRIHRETFFQADGGTEIGIRLVEENCACPKGFRAPGLTNDDPTTFVSFDGVQVADSKFSYDQAPAQLPRDSSVNLPLKEVDYPSDKVRSIRVPQDIGNPSDTDPHTNLAIFGQTGPMPGQALGLSGYENGGRTGQVIDYQIHSQHLGIVKSVSSVRLFWRHLISSGADCRF